MLVIMESAQAFLSVSSVYRMPPCLRAPPHIQRPGHVLRDPSRGGQTGAWGMGATGWGIGGGFARDVRVPAVRLHRLISRPRASGAAAECGGEKGGAGLVFPIFIISAIVNRIIYKMQLVPMRDFTYFLSQFSCCCYVIVYGILLLKRMRSGVVTKPMLAYARDNVRVFAAIGTLEALTFLLALYSAARIPGGLIGVVCMYVCIYVCMYVCIYICIYTRMHAYMYVHVCVCVCVYVCFSVCLSLSLSVCVYVCVCVCMCMCVCTYSGGRAPLWTAIMSRIWLGTSYDTLQKCGGGVMCVCVCVCVCIAGAGCPVMDSDHVPNLAGNTLRYVAKVWGSSRPRRRPLLYLSAGKET
jgi:hypothetical protein